MRMRPAWCLGGEASRGGGQCPVRWGREQDWDWRGTQSFYWEMHICAGGQLQAGFTGFLPTAVPSAGKTCLDSPGQGSYKTWPFKKAHRQLPT